MDEATCPHGLEVFESENTNEVNTYCETCLCDALWNGSLGISLGIPSNVIRQARNKAKAKRRKERLHG